MLVDNDNSKLEGQVQVDETYVGGKNKNRHADKKIEGNKGRAAMDKTPVVGLITKEGKVRTFVVENTDSNTLHTIMGDNVQEGSVLVTDAYRSYLELDARYIHVSVKHEEGGYVVNIGGERFHTNNIKNFWSVFKRGIIGIYHFVSAKHLPRYCNEFGYRHNNRVLTGVEKFNSALLGADNKTLPYLKLIGRLTNGKLDSMADTLTNNPPAHPDSWLDDIDINNIPSA